MFLSPEEVRAAIKQAENDDEVIVVRCIRRGKASKVGGPEQGELYDLHCGKKPPYEGKGPPADRAAEDESNGVLTVFATNRKDKDGNFGAWRRVNLIAVKKVILPNGTEIEVKETKVDD